MEYGAPAACGLFARAISMSGSPRLDAPLAAAFEKWHPQAVARTRCARVGADAPAAQRRCLLALNSSELVAAMPDNWDAAAFSFELFSDAYEHAEAGGPRQARPIGCGLACGCVPCGVLLRTSSVNVGCHSCGMYFSRLACAGATSGLFHWISVSRSAQCL